MKLTLLALTMSLAVFVASAEEGETVASSTEEGESHASTTEGPSHASTIEAPSSHEAVTVTPGASSHPSSAEGESHASSTEGGSCNTADADTYTGGKGMTGHTCPTAMKEGDTCHSICNSNSTSVGTIKCLASSLQDVSWCIPTPLLNTFSYTRARKVVGAWHLGLSKEPSKTQLVKAVVAGMGMPSHFVETVWLSEKSASGLYHVRYWVIVKPSMDPKVIKDKATGFLHPNDVHHQHFKASLESSGISLDSITEASAPTTVQSIGVKDGTGKNINPFEAFPEL